MFWLKVGLWFMVFNATFNNISVLSWWSVLLVEETGVPGENHWPVRSHWQTLSPNVVSSTPRDDVDRRKHNNISVLQKFPTPVHSTINIHYSHSHGLCDGVQPFIIISGKISTSTEIINNSISW